MSNLFLLHKYELHLVSFEFNKNHVQYFSIIILEKDLCTCFNIVTQIQTVIMFKTLMLYTSRSIFYIFIICAIISWSPPHPNQKV